MDCKIYFVSLKDYSGHCKVAHHVQHVKCITCTYPTKVKLPSHISNWVCVGYEHEHYIINLYVAVVIPN